MEDQELIALLNTREARGLDELLRRHGPMLRYIVHPILTDTREQEECLADITMQVWEKVGGYDVERGSFLAWLSALARNKALNRWQDSLRNCRSPEKLIRRLPIQPLARRRRYWKRSGLGVCKRR